MLVRRATIDVGSNSVLVLVAEREDGGPWRRVWETAEITSLGEAWSPGGPLSDEAMTRTTETVRRFHRSATLHGAERVEVVGTMALRTASNAEPFIKLLAGDGIRVRVLTGDEEARLSFLSVAADPTFHNAEGLVVVDIGGASTEVSSADLTTSLPIGTMRIADEMLGPGPCEPDAIFRAGVVIDGLLPARNGRDARAMVVAVGATGVNLACWAANLAVFDPDQVHGAELSRQFVAEAASGLCRMTVDERAAVAGLESGRAPNIHAGALLLERLMDRLNADSIRASSRGLRWGLLEHT